MNRDSRNWKYHFLVAGIIVFLFVESSVFFSIWFQDQVNAPGLQFLRNWAFMVLIAIVISSNYFVQVLSDEKDLGTIGLLKLTGIGPVGILAGLFGSRLVESLIIFSLQLPFIVWAVTLGGVTLHQVLALFATLLSALFLVAALSLFASVICRNTANAQGASFFFLIIPWGSYRVCLLLEKLIGNGTLQFPFATKVEIFCRQLGSAIETVSPYHRVNSILTTGSTDPILGVHVLTTLVLGTFWLFLAIYLFENFTNQTEPVSAHSGPKPTITRNKNRFTRKSQRCWENPYIWREFGFSGGGIFTMLGGSLSAMVLGAGVQFALPLILDRCGFSENQVTSIQLDIWRLWTMATSGLALLAPVVVIATTLGSEVRHQTLGVLFLVGRSEASILRSLILGRVLILVQLIVWASVGLLGVWLTSPSEFSISPPERLPFVFIAVLLSPFAWMYGSIFFGVIGIRLDLIKSPLIKGIFFVIAIQFFPILIGVSMATTVSVFRREFGPYYWVPAVVIALAEFLLSLLILRFTWWSSLRAIRIRMGEN